MNNINKLPIELQNIIYNYYWSSIYYKNVINELNIIKFKIGNMNNYISNNLMPHLRNEYTLKKKEMLILYNNLLENIHINKGMHLFCCLNIKGYNNNIFNKTYKKKVLQNIPENLKSLTTYSIQLYPHARYYFVNDFKNYNLLGP